MHQRAVAADKIDAYFLGYFVHSLAYLFIAAARRADKADGRDGNALVDDGYTVFGGNVVSRFHEISCKPLNLAVDLFRRALATVGYAIEKRDCHCDRAHVEVLTVYHFNRFVNFACVNHLTFFSD